MAHRQVGELSLADALVPAQAGSNPALERIGSLVDWTGVEQCVSGLHGSERGAPSYPPLVMFKAMLLQQWHGLSDPELEAALADRLSFRRFCGFALHDTTPDHVTIHRFREALRREGLDVRLVTEIDRQLDARGLILRRGTLIDASLVTAAVKRPKPPKQAPPVGPDGRAPSKLVKSPRDPDAAWTKKGQARYFGYKVHVAVDQGSGLIRGALLTEASVNDTVPADRLVLGDEASVYADQAYDKKARRKGLAARGIKPRLMFRPNKHHPLTPRSRATTRRSDAAARRSSRSLPGSRAAIAGRGCAISGSPATLRICACFALP